jgi:hypothetical protein
MSIFLVSLILFGAVLGMRFKVLILLPVIACAMAIVVMTGLATGEPTSAILVAGFVASVFLQVGYLSGVAFRSTTARARSGHLHEIRRQPERKLPADFGAR